MWVQTGPCWRPGGGGHLETLIEVHIRHRFSIIGLDGVLELWFQIGSWQFAEKREGGYELATCTSSKLSSNKIQPKCHVHEALLDLSSTNSNGLWIPQHIAFTSTQAFVLPWVNLHLLHKITSTVLRPQEPSSR